MEFHRWCFEEPQRRDILCRLSRILQRKGYKVGKEEVKDLWSDFCSRLWVRMQGYDPRKGRDPLEYAVAGCGQFAVSQFRRRRHEQNPSVLEEEPLPWSEVSRRRSEEEKRVQVQLDRQKIYELLDADLLKIKEEMVLRKRLQDMEYKEIAAEMKISPGHARVLCYRAVQKLIEAFSRKGLFT